MSGRSGQGRSYQSLTYRFEPSRRAVSSLAVSRWIEAQTGWSIRKFVKTARRYRTIEIQAGQHVITAAEPLPGDLRQALDAINHAN
jgi:hypothetical protein